MIVKKKLKVCCQSMCFPCQTNESLSFDALLLVVSLIGGNAVHLASSNPLPGAVSEGSFSYFSPFHVEYFTQFYIFIFNFL